MGYGRPSRGLPSLKMWKRSDKKWGRYRGPKMGFQIADNSYAEMNGEDARRKTCRSDTCIFFVFFMPVGEPMGPFTSAGP